MEGQRKMTVTDYKRWYRSRYGIEPSDRMKRQFCEMNGIEKNEKPVSRQQAEKLGIQPRSKRAAAPSPKEKDIQAAIKEYLQWKGWFCVKIHQSLGSYRGIADLYALKDGRSAWIEVKTPKGRQSEAQLQFEDDVKKHGGSYIVARSLEDVIRWIEGEGG